ncbi:hypothetical protein DFH08DRAFT_1003489 [Mycena albidolilacea]|uniref:SET domain-containing protein n=1 Tax=Mycena albidolilacea TaxID=1033008 RepID=A0AAD7F346_9AGAR|nr:hypothetical protein DFH08DRAFT_1003489 [Mycena albidolilacea]
MKRGFLNDSKTSKTRPLEPKDKAPHVPAAVDTPFDARLNQPIVKTLSFPIGKNALQYLDVPDSGTWKFEERDNRSASASGSMIYMTLPIGAAADEPVSGCLFFAGNKEVVLNTPGFPQPLIHPATPAFRMSTVPGKGMGLFSTRALKMGDLILSERPLLVTVRGMYTRAAKSDTPAMIFQRSLNQLEKYNSIAVERMRDDDKAAFMALANSHKEDGSGPIVGINRTDGLGIEGLRPGVEDETKSCSPSTVANFDIASFSHRLYAVRDIPAGEELTFQYVEVACSAAKRNEELKSYDFVCTCPACTDAPASDARRAAINAFLPNVYVWAIKRELPDDWLTKKCLEQLVRMTIEGLEHHHRFFDATQAIMQSYICLKDADTESLLDPANITAYEAHSMWRLRTDPNATAKIFKNLTALAAKKNVKLPDGFDLCDLSS